MLSTQGSSATTNYRERHGLECRGLDCYTEEDCVTELVDIVFGEDSGPDFSNEDVYLDNLVKAINNETNLDSPDLPPGRDYIIDEVGRFLYSSLLIY